MNPSVLTRRTVQVVVRHSVDCKDKNKGAEWRRCNCPKSVRVYEDGSERRISAKTRSWQQAERFAQNYLDKFDVEKQELKQLRAQKERQQVRIVDAVALYTADMVARLGDNGTCGMARSLLGHVDLATKAIEKNGHLFNWLDTLPPAQRPTYIRDLTPAFLTQWRASWKFGDDTGAQRWGMVRSFFIFCEAQGWIEDSPARRLRRMKVEKGNRTAIFTDEQYTAILVAVALHDPENVPALTRQSWKPRLTTFIELLRWSGMSLIDAVQFRHELVDTEGVLRYRRQKTGVLATLQLPHHVVALLRSVPLERGSLGPEMPFRMKDYDAHSDTVTWRKRLIELFNLTGIKEVRTEKGNARKPHAQMFRDTFAVWNLRHGASLHEVAQMLGHSNTATTERSYLPWVKELEVAHIAHVRTILEHAAPKADGKVVAIHARR
jgi:site-specific recombinase XerD